MAIFKYNFHSSRLLRLWLVVTFFVTFSACLDAKKLTQIKGEDNLGLSPGDLSQFRDEYPDFSQQFIKQTVEINILIQGSPEANTKTSGLIVDNKNIITAAHLLNNFVTMMDNQAVARYEKGTLVILDSRKEVIYRSDFLFDQLFADKHSALSMSPAISLAGIASGHHQRAPGLDLAVVTLKQSSFQEIIGIPIFSLPFDPNPPEPGDRLFYFGYGSVDGDLNLHAKAFGVDENLKISLAQPNASLYYRRVDGVDGVDGMRPGDSGGPLMVYRKSTNKFAYIGLNVGVYMRVDSQHEVFASFRHPIVSAFLKREGFIYLSQSPCLPRPN